MDHWKQSMRWLAVALSIGAPACGGGDSPLAPGLSPEDGAAPEASSLGDVAGPAAPAPEPPEGGASIEDPEGVPPATRRGPEPPTPPEAGVSGACIESLEPNDSQSSACDVTLDQRITSSLSGSDETDFFAFAGLADHTYTLDLVATGSCSSYGISSRVTLDQSNEELVELLSRNSQGTTRVTREFTPATDGHIVIELEGSCGYELVIWQSIADGLEQDPENFEPNHSPAIATPLALDAPAVSAVTVAVDPDDFFAVDVSAGESYTLDVIATGACSSFGIATGVTLLSPSGRVELLGGLSHGTTRVAREFRPSASGVAIVGVSGNCGYELAVLRGTEAGLVQNQATLEPNNSPSTGSPLTLDEVVSSTVSSSVDPDDFFGLPVLAGQVYALELIGRSGCSSFGIAASVTLAAASGTSTLLSASSQSTTRTAREFSPNADGVAVIEVSGQCAYDVGVYQASADGLEHDAATFEPNNSPSTGTPLPLDQLIVSQTQSGEDPDDFFIVPVEADATYTVQLTGAGACSSFGITASATLASAAGSSALLAASSQSTNTTARTFTPAADGDAILRISGNCGYELEVLSP